MILHHDRAHMRAREGQELKNASRLVESMQASLGMGGRTSMVVWGW